jgi:hypothetical protein
MKGELGMRNVQEANVPGMGQGVSALTHVNHRPELECVTGGVDWLEVAGVAALGFYAAGPVGAIVGAVGDVIVQELEED